MNTPSSVKTKDHLDHIIYMPLLFFFFFFFGVLCFFFCFFFFCFFVFSKSAQVGLRLPDCTHVYSNKGFSYSIYNLKGGGGKKRDGERRQGGEKYTPTATKKERKEERKSHHREIYVPSIMEKCAPQTDGSAQANVPLVFLRDHI